MERVCRASEGTGERPEPEPEALAETEINPAGGAPIIRSGSTYCQAGEMLGSTSDFDARKIMDLLSRSLTRMGGSPLNFIRPHAVQHPRREREREARGTRQHHSVSLPRISCTPTQTSPRTRASSVPREARAVPEASIPNPAGRNGLAADIGHVRPCG